MSVVSIKQRLKTAIADKSWNDVCLIYTELFGEKIKVQDGPDDELKQQFAALAAKMGYSISGQKESDSVETIDESEVETEEEKPKKTKVKKKIKIEVDSAPDFEVPKIPAIAGAVKAGKPVFFGEFAKDPAIAKLSEEVAERTIKDKRPANKPVIIKCEDCSSEFDFTKVYPIGMLSTQRKLCDKCRNVKK